MPGVCPRCSRNVFAAEETTALGMVWHTFCFSCYKCRKLLDSSSVSTCDGELFCRSCSASLFGSGDLHEDTDEQLQDRRSASRELSGSGVRLFPCASPSPTAITAWYSRQHPAGSPGTSLPSPASSRAAAGTGTCRRCGRPVYHAEMLLASGAAFHSCCFSCLACRKPLQFTTLWENQGEIFCKQCGVRHFGPRGYGYGQGAGALQTP